MPSKPASIGESLYGIDAALASLPMAPTPRGGAENPFRGEFGDGNGKPAIEGEPEQPDAFAGMGPDLEDDDATVFKRVDQMVIRQELIAQNHLAIDTHWTLVKLGYPWSILEKEPGKDIYRTNLPYGQSAVSIQAVPNKVWDLSDKSAETLLQDFPHAEAEPVDDSEDARQAADMANRFLVEDAGEQGTNDPALFYDRVCRAMTCASSYVEGWVDPTGGGYVPLQIEAHPQATDVNNPLVGPDGMPTTDYILRYVTESQQFTNDASQAAPQWQPKIRANKWDRTHIRCYPESAKVEDAETVIILGYCTLSEGKRRWKDVAAMAPEELSKLCDWTPTRYLPLLPPFQRARWRLSDGREKEKGGSSDQRLFFYYHVFHKASPTYRKGADVVVTGAFGGRTIGKDTLSADVEVDKGQGKTTEVRCMEIPLVQVTLRPDVDERDPTGRAFVEKIAGACENNAFLAMSFSDMIDAILHPDRFISATSPVNDQDVEGARRSREYIYITKPEDKPTYSEQPQIPAAFFPMYELADEAINSIASQERAAQGAETSKERSGKALQIAVAQNNVSNNSPLAAVNTSYSRWCRIKIQLCMKHFTTAQQIRYVGEDGAYKQDEFTGVDFALVGTVSIKAGTGTMMTPDQKVQYFGNLSAANLLDPAEAKDAARASYAKRLGIAADPIVQYVERCIDTWRKGPPEPEPVAPNVPAQLDPATGQPVAPPTWQQQRQQYVVQKQQFDQAQATYSQQVQTFQAAKQNEAAASIPAEEGDETGKASQRQARVNAATTGPVEQPQPPMLEAPVPPWSPFADRPIDTEPVVASIWVRKLRDVIASVKYKSFDPLWSGLVDEKYMAMRQAVAMVAATAQPQQVGQTPPQKLGGGKSTPNQPNDQPGQQGPQGQPQPGAAA